MHHALDIPNFDHAHELDPFRTLPASAMTIAPPTEGSDKFMNPAEHEENCEFT